VTDVGSRAPLIPHHSSGCNSAAASTGHGQAPQTVVESDVETIFFKDRQL
jgi:hypothetical protein